MDGGLKQFFSTRYHVLPRVTIRVTIPVTIRLWEFCTVSSILYIFSEISTYLYDFQRVTTRYRQFF